MSRGWVTPGALKALREMLAAEEADQLEDAELVSEGRQVWLGDRRTSRRVVNDLLRMCLIRDCDEKGKGVERYTLNEEGRAMARDPDYLPLIVIELR